MVLQNLDKYCRITPSSITQLDLNQIFVFGTDLKGSQRYGAAGVAKRLFGAKEGIVEGLTGRAYAIPTKENSYEGLYAAIERFINFAKGNTDKIFLVTPIGCGHAGFSVSVVAPIFIKALDCDNIFLPISFLDFYRSAYNESNSGWHHSKEYVIETISSSEFPNNNTIKHLIELLKSKNIPYNAVGTFSLKDNDDMVIGEAELGIESFKIVVNPLNSPSLLAFKNAGYRVLDINSAINIINNG